MIYKKCIMTINKNNATLDEDIYLFRLDKNIELHFSIVNNRYKFDKSDLNNIIAQTNAAYFQIRLYRSDEIKYTFAIQPTQDGVAILTITDDLINDPIEVGEYDFQISLLDADKTSMISMPIVKQQLHVCEPLVDNQAIMGRAVLGLSSLASGEIKNAFDSEGNYIREVHNDGDILSAQLVNKFEEALDSNTKAIKNQDIPHTISSKVLTTVPSSDITLDGPVTVNNISINKDRRYYIEFLGTKKLCSLLISEEWGNYIISSIGGYTIQAFTKSTNVTLFIKKINKDDTTVDTFTDLIIYEEEVKYLDSKYLETDLTLQNSISLGRVGDIGEGSSAIGIEVEASGMSSHAEGGGTTASGDNSHAEGNNTKASGVASHAEGNATIASGEYQHVQGKYNIEDTANKYAHIVGNGNPNTRANAHTLDWEGNAWYAGKVTASAAPVEDMDLTTKKYVDDNKIGYIKSETVAETIDTSPMISSFKNNSYIYESNNVTYLEMGKEYHVIVNGVRYRALCINNMPGNNQIYETIVVNGNGFSISIMNKFGYNTKYYPDNTKCAYEIKLSDELLAAPPTIQILKMDIEYIPTYLMPKDLGILNSISINRIGDIGTGSVAIGYNNTASNDFTFAMGINTTAIATAAHAEGGYTVANASYSHAEGFKSISTGEYSHVEGIICKSSGQGSHAEGYYTVASGQRSHSEGCFTEAASQYQHVQGKYNVVDSTGAYAHIVGNGSNKNARSNAYTLDWKGNGWYAGKLSQEGTPTENKDLATKKYVDDKVSSLPQISFNENGELVVTINGVSKTFVPKAE